MHNGEDFSGAEQETITGQNPWEKMASEAPPFNPDRDEAETPEQHESDDEPDTLYRGVKISYKDLPNFKFSGEDLVVNYEPIIDNQGRRTVTDGNEYGVYV